MMWTRRIASLATLPVVLTLAACQGEPRPQEEAPPPPGEQQEVAQAAYAIEVVNPMPHAMIVTSDYGMGAVELGVVEPMGTATFSVTAPAGTVVKLTAADEAKSHTVQGEVTLVSEMTPSWTIGK
jgi:hypothetical protein